MSTFFVLPIWNLCLHECTFFFWANIFSRSFMACISHLHFLFSIGAGFWDNLVHKCYSSSRFSNILRMCVYILSQIWRLRAQFALPIQNQCLHACTFSTLLVPTVFLGLLISFVEKFTKFCDRTLKVHEDNQDIRKCHAYLLMFFANLKTLAPISSIHRTKYFLSYVWKGEGKRCWVSE